MKYLGAAYVLYLAWQTWRRLPPSDSTQEKKPTWIMGFFLQTENKKAAHRNLCRKKFDGAFYASQITLTMQAQ